MTARRDYEGISRGCKYANENTPLKFEIFRKINFVNRRTI